MPLRLNSYGSWQRPPSPARCRPIGGHSRSPSCPVSCARRKSSRRRYREYDACRHGPRRRAMGSTNRRGAAMYRAKAPGDVGCSFWVAASSVAWGNYGRARPAPLWRRPSRRRLQRGWLVVGRIGHFAGSLNSDSRHGGADAGSLELQPPASARQTSRSRSLCPIRLQALRRHVLGRPAEYRVRQRIRQPDTECAHFGSEA